jgi:hypothetical protein
LRPALMSSPRVRTPMTAVSVNVLD